MKPRDAINKLIENGITLPIVLIGPSAAGKDTLLQYAVRQGLSPLVSHTTRPKRLKEEDGVQYHFVDEETFESIPMIERREYTTLVGGIPQLWKYGLSEIEGGRRKSVLILDWDGYLEYAAWFKKLYSMTPVSLYINIDKETARSRQMMRGDYDNVEFERRWEADKKWCAEAKEKALIVVEG